MDAELSQRLELAVSAAREAGQLTLRYFQRDDLAVELKRDATPVTVADRESEKLMRERISRAFPADGILGEELAETSGTSGFRWILDPIDGTKSFIHGVPLYGTLIGVEHGGESVLGVIQLPALQESAYAVRGHGAWHVKGDQAPRAARVSACAKLEDALFCTSEVVTFAQVGRHAAFEQFQAATRLTRTWGDCFGYLLVATGRADVMVDPQMSIWDAAALQPILEEAGGTFTDWQGRPTIHSGNGIATNGHLLQDVLAISRMY